MGVAVLCASGRACRLLSLGLAVECRLFFLLGGFQPTCLTL